MRRAARARPSERTIVSLFVVVLALLAGSGAAQAAADVTPPTVTIHPNGALTALQRVVFGEDVVGVTPDNVVLRVAGTTVNLPVSLRCSGASGSTVSCTGLTTRTVEMRPGSPLVAGQSYDIIVNPDGAVPLTDGSANAAATTTRPFTASVVEQESSAGATFRWHSIGDSRAYGGSYNTDNAPGSMAIFRFVGTSVAWYTKLGPAEGRATVTIDGKLVAVYNNYRPSEVFPASRRFGGLANTSHVLVIVVRGEKGHANGRGTWVAVDAVRANSGAYEDAAYRWPQASAPGAAGGRLARSANRGTRVAFTFKGGGVDWFTVTGPAEGKALVYIDGVLSRTYDNYGVTTRYGVRRTITGLTDAVHVMTIVVTGTRNRLSRGTSISVDQWVLRAPVTIFRKLGAWVDLYDYTSSTPESTIAAYVADMNSRGVKTLYLQTGRYNTNAFHWPTQAGQWLQHAHAAGIAVVGWYLPAYSEYLDGDVAKTAAIASFTGPGGHRFDGLAIDIEYRAKTSSKTEFFTGISSHLAQVRSRVGLIYPVGAITFAPLDMDLWTAGWSGFPWASVAQYANVAMPMGYWSNRDGLCEGGQTAYCPYQYTLQNILRTRSATGLPVHDIGGVGHSITASEVAQYAQASLDARAWGGSLYDYRTTSSSFWTPLAGLNAL